MTKVDQFEGVFRAAARPTYEYHPLVIGTALIASDLDTPERDAFEAEVTSFTRALPGVSWTSVGRDGVANPDDLLELVNGHAFDLVVTYRHLGTGEGDWPHGLGARVDLLAQGAPCPVLVMPHPQARAAAYRSIRSTDTVVVATDRLSGDARLINYAVCFAADGGELVIAHVEDEAVFDRYMDALARIPALDFDVVKAQVRERLLDEAEDYVKSCRSALGDRGTTLEVRGQVSMGSDFEDIERVVGTHGPDLVVTSTRDELRPAMRGMAYSLASELRDVPILLL